MAELKSPWSGHWREGEYFRFVRWALGQPPIRAQYREATGDTFEPSVESMDDQIQSGEAHAFVQRFSDWLAPNVFGLPDDDFDEPQIVMGRTMH